MLGLLGLLDLLEWGKRQKMKYATVIEEKMMVFLGFDVVVGIKSRRRGKPKQKKKKYDGEVKESLLGYLK